MKIFLGRLLAKFGIYLKPLLTEEIIYKLSLSLFSDVSENAKFTKEEEKLVAKQLFVVEGYSEYLKSVMAKDIKRYFAASSPVEQLMIKGAYNRTLYFYTKNKTSDVPVNTKVASGRYI